LPGRVRHPPAQNEEGKFEFLHMFPGLDFDLFYTRPGFRTGAGESSQIKLKPGEAMDLGDIKLNDPKKKPEE
jgi:hypothetical protein